MTNWHLPKEFNDKFCTRESVSSDNASLLWNRYYKHIDKGHNDKGWKNEVFTLLKGISQTAHNVDNYMNIFKFYYETESAHIVYKTASLTSRLLTGIGYSHPSEVSIYLSFINGIPIIPGSVIKGSLRSYYLKKQYNLITQGISSDGFEEIIFLENILEDNISNDQLPRPQNSIQRSIINYIQSDNSFEEFKISFHNIFGHKEAAGKVMFMDAFPDTFNFSQDIMTPHYSEYYQGREFPQDRLTVNPIKYLVIDNAIYNFWLINRTSRIGNNTLHELLFEMLQNQGLGAKTSNGYGRFKDAPSYHDTFKNYCTEVDRSLEEEYESHLSILKQLENKLDKKIEKNAIQELFNKFKEYINESPSEFPIEDRKIIAKKFLSLYQNEVLFNKKERRKQKQKDRESIIQRILDNKE